MKKFYDEEGNEQLVAEVKLRHELIKREGFWYSESNKLLPKPIEGESKPWPGRMAFLVALEEREAEAKTHHTRGWSNCRICGCENGTVTFELDGWQWPSGYRHYIVEHNVRPSLAFQEFILGELIK